MRVGCELDDRQLLRKRCQVVGQSPPVAVTYRIGVDDAVRARYRHRQLRVRSDKLLRWNETERKIWQRERGYHDCIKGRRSICRRNDHKRE